jgi:hypothetical protein
MVAQCCNRILEQQGLRGTCRTTACCSAGSHLQCRNLLQGCACSSDSGCSVVQCTGAAASACWPHHNSVLQAQLGPASTTRSCKHTCKHTSSSMLLHVPWRCLLFWGCCSMFESKHARNSNTPQTPHSCCCCCCCGYVLQCTVLRFRAPLVLPARWSG